MEKMILERYFDILEYKKRPSGLDKYLLCPSIRRLKQVGYFCGMDYASKEIYDFSEKISRYDHSLTVALIVWNLTKDMKMTLAGLFHDIATPCFSHVIDYMNKDYEKQESTEEKTGDILKSDTYLLECLKEDNISIDEVIDFKKYSIVDLDRPMLCADRLDGVILTGLFWTKSITIDDVEKIISDLLIVKNENNQDEIAFRSSSVAKLVLETSKVIDIYCHSNEDNYMMELLAKITRRAIYLNIISYDDLFILNESEIFERLDMSNDMELNYDLNLFRNIRADLIPKQDMPYVKVRNLNPLVHYIRLR